LFFCQEKKLSIYFPYSENLKTLVKSKQLLRNTLKFLALSLVIIALASPITTKEVILDNIDNFFSWQKNKQANTAIMSANT
jgi:hypothetical protein